MKLNKIHWTKLLIIHRKDPTARYVLPDNEVSRRIWFFSRRLRPSSKNRSTTCNWSSTKFLPIYILLYTSNYTISINISEWGTRQFSQRNLSRMKQKHFRWNIENWCVLVVKNILNVSFAMSQFSVSKMCSRFTPLRLNKFLIGITNVRKNKAGSASLLSSSM